jgi:hypothetical protein
MRRISAIVLLAIALFFGSFTFAAANPDPTGDGNNTDGAGGTAAVNGGQADNSNGNSSNKDGGNGGDNGANQVVSNNDHGGNLTLISLSDQYKQVDVGPKGDSLGDQMVFSDKLYEDSGSNQVGTLDGFCVLTHVNKEKKSITQECVITLTLPKGHLTAQGVIRFSAATAHDAFPIAITGGTSNYDHASGEAHVTFLSDTRTKIVLDLNS